MNHSRFDALVRSLTDRSLSRHALTRGLVAAGISAGLVAQREDGLDANRRTTRRNGKKGEKNPSVNRLGCRNVGVGCSTAGQCCSGICERGRGKKAKKRCRAHDTGDCRLEDDSCLADPVPCITRTGAAGFCQVTTGNAPYCAVSGVTFNCTRDEECIDLCGKRAACGVCADPDLGTFRICAGLRECAIPPEE